METGSDDPTLAGDDSLGSFHDPSLGRGDALGRYVILKPLGSGGMGIVYAAYDPELDRKVAIKLIHWGRGDDEANSRGSARLLREAQALAKLSHPNVVAIHDVGQYEDQVFIAMEFIEGLTLTQWLAARDPDWREVLHVLQRAGEGLAAAHEKGIIHRDFKPDNVMIADDGRVRVLDFGLARAAGEDDPRPSAGEVAALESSALSADITRAGAAVGTPAYMAPEQHLGERAEAPADQFAFGVTAFIALYGERPFAGDSPAAIAFNVCEGQIREPTRGRRVPRWVRAVVYRALSRQPKDRWPTMRSLLDALGRDPARRRRRLLAAGAVAAVGAGLWGSHAYDEARRVDGCETDAAAITEVWNESSRGELRTGLAGSGSAWEITSAEKTEQWIVQYASDWSSARRESCLAAGVAGTRTVDLDELTVACLDERREALAALLKSLASDDPQVLSRAVPAAAGLPLITDCLDDRRLAQRTPPPTSPKGIEAKKTIEAQLAEARSLNTLGRHAEAGSLAGDAAAAAEELAWGPLVAAAHFEVGVALDEQGKYEDAERELRVAFFSASRSGEDELGSAIAGRLAFVLAYRLRHVDDARLWIELASALLDRSGEAEGLPRARWLMNVAAVDLAAAEVAQGAENYSRSLALKRTALGDDHPGVADALSNLAVAKGQLGDWAASKALLTESLEIDERAFGPNHPSITTKLTTLAQAHFRLGEVEEARSAARRALEIVEASSPPDHPDVAKALVTLANTTSNPEESLPLLERAHPILEKSMGADHPWVTMIAGNLAVTQLELGNAKEALPELERTLERLRAANGPEHPDVAMALFNLSQAQSALDQHAAAIQNARAAVEIRRKTEGPEHPNVAYVEERLGIALLAKGDAEAARAALERALALHERHEHPAAQVADCRFALARAIVAREPDRARALAEAARDGFGADDADEAEEVSAWLRQH